MEDKCLEKCSTGCQLEVCLYSKIAPETKSEVSAKTWEGRSELKIQSTEVKVSYNFIATKAVWALLENINFAGLSQSRPVKGVAIEAYPLTKWW